MARSDKSAFRGVLLESEDALDELFDGLAEELGRALMAMAGPGGLVPEQALPELKRRVDAAVTRRMLGVGSRPFNDGGQAMAEYPRILQRGMLAQTDLALLRSAAWWRNLDDQTLAEVKRKWPRRGR